MFKYQAKTTFTGYKIGLENPSLYIGVPKKYFKPGRALPVGFDNKTRFYSKKEAKTERTFNDRFEPNKTYTLLYFLWQRKKKGEL